jgi:gas vesicle structural protein
MGESDVLLRAPGEDGTLLDVLDRVLDKGIVIGVWGRLSLVGIELVGVDMRVVVASIDTYLRYADTLGMARRD